LCQELIFKLTTIFSTLQKGFDTFKNALTFETKRLCVSTKAPLRFNQNSLAFYLERKGVLKRMQRKFFRKKKLHRKALLKDFTMQLF
ncbi:hypothetical protein, partial [Phocaeicola plebeius]|uniref:hypothetical protein n=1 Tax=Phocaeicola plebeius TaxID=310297 RepID=UPI00307A1259